MESITTEATVKELAQTIDKVTLIEDKAEKAYFMISNLFDEYQGNYLEVGDRMKFEVGRIISALDISTDYMIALKKDIAELKNDMSIRHEQIREAR
ncbi:hypothetical protein [Parasporobacterium paucivorans]|uniref:Uncharacterized protein n=1 Tax=Parasporobacterium paucivorans DSM 15970 TaxID=1122934 RepID=A0A1M6F2G9_9FIRM|nr:hypothetical protein [Parasporobacterium paucivorans]SHI91846.1 hypothetical protein SAMN02745691_01032 [Parasporobacterium paucivorans DSM 15970]